MTTRIIGIDLAVEAAHKAVVLDQASNEFVSGLMPFHTDPAEIERVVQAARVHATDPVRLVAVLEATAMSWFTVGSYLIDRGVEVYRVHGRQTADQRKVYRRYAKSDRVDARVLARLYLNFPESLNRLHLPSGPHMELQRVCRELARLVTQITAIKNRLLAIDGYAWLGLRDIVLPHGPAARWLRTHWYNPWQVLEAGTESIAQAWKADHPEPSGELDWIAALLHKAQQVTSLYREPQRIDYEHLQASLAREQARLQQLEEQEHHLRVQVLRPLYRKLYPQRHLETLPGVGQDSAAVYISFIDDIRRFPSLSRFRAWSGLVPASSQSGNAEAKGLHITQAGHDLVKSTAFLNAGISRLYDPQIAAIYYDQMVSKGKHHLQAVCACATHLLNRIYTVLGENRPYQLRDVEGTPVSKKLARAICQERYHVPEEVRRRNNYRVRRARAEQQLEQHRQRGQRKGSKG